MNAKRVPQTHFFEPAPRPPQHLTNNSPTEERAIGDTRRPSSSHWPLVRARPPAGTEDERRVLCESLSSSASNSQHSLTGPPPASLTNRPNACPAAPWQPDRRVRAAAHLRPCFLPSHLLPPCVFLLINALLCSLSPSCLSYFAPLYDMLA